MLGVKGHVVTPVDAVPAPASRFGTDHQPCDIKRLSVIARAITQGDFGVQVCEIPLDRTHAHGLEVDETRVAVNDEDVVAVGRPVEDAGSRTCLTNLRVSSKHRLEQFPVTWGEARSKRAVVQPADEAIQFLAPARNGAESGI